MKLPRNRNNTKNAAYLRKNMTQQERRLWYDFLRDYPVRFRRQELIGNYIADFFCDKARLVIEVDGSQHYEPKEIVHDRQRTKYFESLRLKVIRFTNLEINTNFNGVCEYIDRAVKRLPLEGSCHAERD